MITSGPTRKFARGCLCVLALLLPRETSEAEDTRPWLRYGFGLVREQQVSSPSSKYVVKMSPINDEYGTGVDGATYSFFVNGTMEWKKKACYTLREMVLTDSGTMVGFAYTQCGQGLKSQGREVPSLTIVITDRDGKVMVRKSSARRPPPPSTPPVPGTPYVLRQIVDPDIDRLLYLVQQPGCEELWRFVLSTGEELDPLECALLRGNERGPNWVSDVSIVPGLPLLLAHSVVFSGERENRHAGALFTIIDLEQGRLVWKLALPNDYDRLLGTSIHLGRYLREDVSIVDAHQGRFSIYEHALRSTRSFTILDNKKAGWNVAEVTGKKRGHH